MLMSVDINLLLSIALLLVVAKVFGEIAERLKTSSLVGEIIAGIVMGPVLKLVTPEPILAQIAGFGIIFSMFIIGLDTKFDEKSNIYSGSIIAIISCGLLFIAGFFVGYLVFGNILIGVILGIAILSSSTLIALRSLTDIGELHSPAGKFLLIVEMADEVIAILMLALLTSFLTFGKIDVWNASALFFAILGFFLFIIKFGTKAVGKFLTLFQTARDEQMLVSIPLFIVFIVAFVSEHVGVAAVTGAFLAGMAMSRSPVTQPIIIPKMKTIGYGFFIPLFFAYSAIMLDLGMLISSLWIVLVLLVLVIVINLISGYASGYFGFSNKEKKIIGIGLIPRGEYSIIIAQIALVASAITVQLYGVIIAFVLLSIIITPLFLRFLRQK